MDVLGMLQSGFHFQHGLTKRFESGWGWGQIMVKNLLEYWREHKRTINP